MEDGRESKEIDPLDMFQEVEQYMMRVFDVAIKISEQLEKEPSEALNILKKLTRNPKQTGMEISKRLYKVIQLSNTRYSDKKLLLLTEFLEEECSKLKMESNNHHRELFELLNQFVIENDKKYLEPAGIKPLEVRVETQFVSKPIKNFELILGREMQDWVQNQEEAEENFDRSYGLASLCKRLGVKKPQLPSDIQNMLPNHPSLLKSAPKYSWPKESELVALLKGSNHQDEIVNKKEAREGSSLTHYLFSDQNNEDDEHKEDIESKKDLNLFKFLSVTPDFIADPEEPENSLYFGQLLESQKHGLGLCVGRKGYGCKRVLAVWKHNQPLKRSSRFIFKNTEIGEYDSEGKLIKYK